MASKKKSATKSTGKKKTAAKKTSKRIRKAAPKKSGSLVYPVTLLAGRSERVFGKRFKRDVPLTVSRKDELAYFRCSSRFAVGEPK